MEVHEERPSTWIFQANPDRFDISNYLAFAPKRITYLVRQSMQRIKPGDQVFIWRAFGKSKNGPAGIIAECRVNSPVVEIEERPEAIPYWRTTEEIGKKPRVWLRVLRVADPRSILKRDELLKHPELSDLEPITFSNATNFRVKPHEVGPLNLIWLERTNSLTADDIEQEFEKAVGNLEKESLDELRVLYAKRSNDLGIKPRKTEAVSVVFERDPVVKVLALKRANHQCEVPGCDNAMFLCTGDKPYCEVHHLEWLSSGGMDAPDNVVCVCANHHRELHFGKERDKLRITLTNIRREHP